MFSCLDCDGDRVNDGADDFPLDPTETTDTDGDGTGNNADADDDNDTVLDVDEALGCSLLTDCDGDNINDDADLDDDGDGLIELWNATMLHNIRYALDGSGYRENATVTINRTSCGGGFGGQECIGYELIANISLASYTDYDDGRGWLPIGHDTNPDNVICGAEFFDALFEGNNMTVSNLTIARADEDCIGLFGRISSDTWIRNLHLQASSVAGHRSVGGLVGGGSGFTIMHSSVVVSGSVAGHRSVGGLVGGGSGFTIMHSSVVVSGSVTGAGHYVGGLVGFGADADIMHSSAVVSGSVTGDGSAGGLVGYGQETDIMNSYSVSGSVTGDSSVGGLVGWGSGADITNSFAVSGSVTGYRVGGLVGEENDDTTITASYWDSDTSGLASGSYGEPQTSDTLRAPASATGIYANWDDGDCGWDFGNKAQYPALLCLLISPEAQRALYDGDGDGVINNVDVFPLNAGESADTDGDGIGDNADRDDDNDTVLDIDEESGCALLPDCDNDTVLDRDEALGCALLVDCDGDRVNDGVDAFPLNASESGDADGDGVGDNADTDDDNNGEEDRDADGDNVGDNADRDDDNDGLIELWNATMLHNVRYALDGSGYRESPGGTISNSGCGGGSGGRECIGYELIANISLAAYIDYDDGKGWLPIGHDTDPNNLFFRGCQGESFNSLFEGNGMTVSNLTIARSLEDCVGLFGWISSDARIHNLHLEASSVAGSGSVGGLVGYGAYADITHSSAQVNGKVSGEGYFVDGLVRGGHYVGGLVGYGVGATITHSSAVSDTIMGRFRVGGLVGYGRDADITHSSAVSGSVMGSRYVGGLVGDGRDADITHSSAQVNGNVRGTSFNVGGLVGDGVRATITHSSAVSGSVTGGSSVGGLVGDGGSVTITHSSAAVSGSVTGGNNVGGLVGYGYGADITHSYSVSDSVTESGYIVGGYVGGLVGWGGNADITNSYSVSGSVTGGNNVGGLLGAGSDRTNITASYWDSDTSGITSGSYGEPKTSDALRMPTSTTGIYANWTEEGECGWDFGSFLDYPALRCLPISPEAQRLLYDGDGDGVINNVDAFPLNASESADTDGDGIGDNADTDDDNDMVLDGDEELGCALLADCDNDMVLDGDEESGCVLLADCDGDETNDGEDAFPLNASESGDADGDGVGDNADTDDDNDGMEDRDADGDNVGDNADRDDDNDGLIELWNATMLYNVRYALDGSGYRENATGTISRSGCGGGAGGSECIGYELIANISLASYMDYDGGKGWLPIGHDTNSSDYYRCQGESFNSLFEGNGMTVSNLTIARSLEDCVGLFGWISSDARIRNIHLRASSVTGSQYVGSLVGYGEGAMITNVSAVFGSVMGRSAVGGLVGYGDNAIITHSHSVSGSVTGRYFYVGGLVGYGDNAIIMNSSAMSGSVTGGGSSVGGLVGSGRYAIITHSYSVSGSVMGSQSVGGLVGSGTDTTITHSSTVSGAIAGDEYSVGGLVGSGRNADITNSYSVSGSVMGGSDVGGLVGYGGGADITTSYAISGSVTGTEVGIVGGLVGGASRASNIIASYWDSDTSSITNGSYGEPQTSDALRMPISATGIYANWTEEGKCGWDFGSSLEYPALLCLPISPEAQRLLYDRDGDKVIDIVDADDDNDGVLDTEDIFPYDATESGDADGDGIGDNADADDDNDGVLDAVDVFPYDPTESGDADGDGIGDNADADDDNDGVLDAADDFPKDSTETTDTDEDGIGDNADTDDDNDGVLDVADAFPLDATESVDADGDNVGDNVDRDDDNDGLIELWNATMLYNVRYALDGSGYSESAGGAISSAGCGGGAEGRECIGYELIANISLASYTDYDDGKGWLPIAHDTDPNDFRCQGESFSALFEGNNRTVSNLTIARDDEDCVGLFGWISLDTQIRNIHLEASSVTGRNYVGGLVGWGSGANITHSSAVSGSVTGDYVVGGLVGLGVNADITHSSAVSGSVNGTGSSVGGLVGWGDNADIAHSSAVSGSVTGRARVGGLVGDGWNANITHSFAVSGSVTGYEQDAGGLVGLGVNADITTSYAMSGSVMGGSDVGGLVGNGEYATVTYSSAAVSGSITGRSFAGGLVGEGFGATITHSSAVSGSVTGTEVGIVGGLVGEGSRATITHSSAVSGSVTGAGSSVGGLVGEGLYATITNSSAVSGSVNGSEVIGGLVGNGEYADITHSSAVSGSVNGFDIIGGLVGLGHSATITHSYSVSGSVTGTEVGGLVGRGAGDTNITASYWDSDISGITSGSYGEPQTSDALRMPTSATGIYADWGQEGECGWDFGNSAQYPALLCLPISLEAQWALYSVSGGEVIIRLPEQP